jgi:hypothetical protein
MTSPLISTADMSGISLLLMCKSEVSHCYYDIASSFEIPISDNCYAVVG